jgi:hypothetical protein
VQEAEAYLDGLGVDFQALFLVDEEVFHGIALVALELDHVASLFIVDDGTVAGKLLLDDLEDFLEIKLGRDALDGGQGLATIAFCVRECGDAAWRTRLTLDADMDVGLGGLLGRFAGILILRIRKGIYRRSAVS